MKLLQGLGYWETVGTLIEQTVSVCPEAHVCKTGIPPRLPVQSTQPVLKLCLHAHLGPVQTLEAVLQQRAFEQETFTCGACEHLKKPLQPLKSMMKQTSCWLQAPQILIPMLIRERVSLFRPQPQFLHAAFGKQAFCSTSRYVKQNA